MHIDWLAIVRGQQKVARDAARMVMDQLANPNLTLRETAKLQHQVEVGSVALNALLRSLQSRVIDEAFLFSAASLKSFWSDLAAVIRRKEEELASGSVSKARHRH